MYIIYIYYIYTHYVRCLPTRDVRYESEFLYATNAHDDYAMNQITRQDTA